MMVTTNERMPFKMARTIDPTTVTSPLVFRRRRRRRLLPNNKQRCSTTTSYVLLCVAALLVLGTTMQGYNLYQPVAAFTPKSTTSTILGVHRHRVNTNNNNKTVTVLAASRSKNDLSNNEEEDNKNNDTPTTPQLTSKSGCASSSSSFRFVNNNDWKQQVRRGYNRRVNADPSFFGKSITEVLVAAGTQLMAEWSRRGASRMIPELDFVVPAVLAAVFGKYYRYVRANTLQYCMPFILFMK